MLVLPSNQGKNVNWKDPTHDIATKLNRAIALLYKIKNHVSFNTLKAIYFAVFKSDIYYGNLIQWLIPSYKTCNLQKNMEKI